MGALRAAVAVAGWALLGLAALAGVGLSALALFAATDLGRPIVASTIVRIADQAVAGRLELEGIRVLPGGVVEIRGLRAYDPDGHLVLAVDRARVSADVTRLRSRVIGLRAELDGPTVLLEEEPDGGLSLARAFAPAHPSEPRPARPGQRDAGPGWTVRVLRLAIRGADVWWVDARGATRLEAQGLSLDARGAVGPETARAELRVKGALDVPVSAPLELELRVRRAGDAVRLRWLSARVGETRLQAVGEGDLGRRTGRLHLARVGVDHAQTRALLPAARLGADLEAEAYAESDGGVVTAAARVAPAPGTPGSAGRADAAAAMALDDAGAVGFDVALDRLDPAKVFGPAPAGEVTLAAHGAVAGRSVATLRARLDLSLARSRLRGGEAGPAEVVLRADGGGWELARGRLAAPGLALEATGRWRDAGAVSGRVDARSGDLAVAARNLARLLDEPLPALGGDLRLAGTLSGSASAPAITATLGGGRVALGALSASALRADLASTGPLRAPTVRLDAAADALRSRGEPVARAVLLRGTLTGGEAQLSGSAAVAALGRDPVTLQARARLGERSETIALSELAIGYPGTRYVLVRPATVTLAGPRVDRLELAAGPQRIAFEGGVGAREALDAHLVVERLDVARLPVGARGARERIAGKLGVDLRATGTLARPHLAGRLSLEEGAFRNLVGLRASGDVAWDGRARRAAGTLALARSGGGTVDLALDLPVPLAGRPAEPLSLRARAAGLPLDVLLGMGAEPPADAVAEPPAAGLLGLDAAVSGTAGAPVLRATATLEDGRLRDLGAVGLTATADAPGERLDLHAEAALSGRPAAVADLSAPLDLSDLLARPAETVRALRAAALSGRVRLPGLELADVAGRLGVPDDVRGRLTGEAALAGSIDAPRGTAVVELASGSFSGYGGVSGRVELTAGAARVDARARAAVDGDEVLHATASLGAPLERLATRDGLRRAALALDATVPRIALPRAARLEVPLAGTVEARIVAAGTLAAPRLELDASGRGLSVDGRPLGDATVSARSGAGRTTAEAELAPPAGGALRATFAAEIAPGLDLRAPALRAAAAEVALHASAVDLGFLPALAPGVVRTASGRLDADVTARGPLARLSPVGRVRLANGRFAVSEYGDFTAVTLEAAVTDDAVEVTRLAARRGSGTLEASGALRGLRAGSGQLRGHLAADNLVLSRAGMEVATLTTRVDATGTYHLGKLDVRLDVPRGTLKLPKRTPRALQPLERRTDIVVGPRPERRAPRRGGTGEAGADARPFVLAVRLVSPGRFDVVSDNPRLRIELKADASYELQGGNDYLTGSVEVVRGNVEPLGGRLFEVERGKVTFTGGPPKAAMVDVEARWDNPSAVVTVRVAGPLSDPDIKLSSQPPLDESQIAMLIATGRTELKAGGGGVGTLTGEEAGKAALGALATQLFKDLVADKLPLDTVALDSGALRAGKYVTDRVYVGYTRRFEARPEQGENTNEVRVEYQITPRWSLESRYGDAQSGGASLIWSKDY